ncbi:MAG: type I restriction-modification system subunit M N-terminal domain-containing protein, partial [Candidatus Omnitrophica bacterium]|nr:type I restriction-modification system subunit M N-terminal domain-containing protein [Candidatus Omnitrophota bacterium]
KELQERLANKVCEDFIPYGEIREKAVEDKDRYLSEGILYVPEKARWDYLLKHANQPNIGEILDKAIEILEEEYPKHLKDVIPKIYTRINLDSFDLAYLINTFTSIDFGYEHKRKDIFGR